MPRAADVPPRPAVLGRLPAWARPLRFRTAWMQRIQDRVRAGYTKWVGGEIEPERWPSLADKLDAHYDVARTTKQRARAKAKGAASAMLIAYYDANYDHDEAKNEVIVTPVVRWMLQLSAGAHPAHEIERKNLKDATTREGRIVVPRLGYQLLRIDNKWTWKMTSEHIGEWHVRIRLAASHSDPDYAGMLARQIVWSLCRVPGFRGVRRDAFALRGVLLAEWKRLRRKEGLKLLPPKPWPRIGYARRVKSE